MTNSFVTIIEHECDVLYAIVLISYLYDKLEKLNSIIITSNKLNQDCLRLLSLFYDKIDTIDENKINTYNLYKYTECDNIMYLPINTLLTTKTINIKPSMSKYRNNENITFNHKPILYKYCPYIFSKKYDTREQLEDKNNIKWHKTMNNILNKYEYLLNNPIIQKYNEYLKYKTFYNTSYDANKLTLFPNIKPFEYFEPMRILSDTNEYFANIYKHKHQTEQSMNKICTSSDIKLDLNSLEDVLLHYVKCRENTRVFVMWNYIAQETDIINMIEKYLTKNECFHYYTKTIILNENGMHNFMYWLYDDIKHENRINMIKEKMNNNKSTDKNQYATIIIYENKNKHIYGQDTQMKRNLRNKIQKITKSSINPMNYLHANDHYYQTITCCSMILNENTLKCLNKQKINNNTEFLKKNNYNQIELIDIVYYGDIYMYMLGLKTSYEDTKKLKNKKETYDPKYYLYMYGCKILDINKDTIKYYQDKYIEAKILSKNID